MKEATELDSRVKGLTTEYPTDLADCCRTAKDLEEAGNYETARKVLEQFWPNRAERPMTEGLDDLQAGELLLRCGALTGWLGSAFPSKGSQEAAKDLIAESLRLFDLHGAKEKSAEAHCDLAFCYWREGSLEEARIHIQEALGLLDSKKTEQRAVALLRGAVIELSATRLNEALALLDSAAPLFDTTESHVLKGKFHANRGIVLKNLSRGENQEAYADRALIEMEAASFHFEQARLTRYRAYNENNLGFLLFTLGRLREAEMHLGRAARLFNELRDESNAAQVGETRARVMVGRGRYGDAQKLAKAAVHILEKGDQQSLLAEALTTQGIAEARLYKFQESSESFRRAIDLAAQAGASERSGLAALAMIEELGTELNHDQVSEAYARAHKSLIASEDKKILIRLARAASYLLEGNSNAIKKSSNADGEIAQPSAAETDGANQATPFDKSLTNRWTNFNFLEEVVRFENVLISDALHDAAGKVSVAARLLDMTYQGLTQRLCTRNQGIKAKRKPAVKRRRSVIKKR